MAITTFIPEVWSGKLLSAMRKAQVYAALVNRDYEGDIAQAGDTVRINSVGDPTIGTYTPNSTSISPEVLTTADMTLTIDQSKYFAFKVDDVDKRQAEGSVMGEAMERAAYLLADEADKYLVALYSGVASGNDVGTVSVTTGDLAYTNLVKLRTKLNAANVPAANRWVVVPGWYTALLLENSKFVANPALSQTGQNLLNGVVGKAAGFDIYESNNVPVITGDDYAVLAGTPQAITFAEQIDKVEAYRPEASFSDAVKGLYLYGAKLTRNSGVALLRASVT